jgi:prepilin-type N-terminal cleavage/methylation domain-containing protein
MKNEKGFSLIELSIVLIIIGLLVSGITGGASLINSARVRSTMTEVTNYRIAVNTYYSTKDYYPGDDNDVVTTGKDGKINTTLEIEEAWKAMYDLDLIDKVYLDVTAGAALVKLDGLGYTKNAGAGWMMAYYTDGGSPALDFNAIALTDEDATYVKANASGIVGGSSGNVVAGTTGVNAGSMDVKMDDGTIDSGNVVGLHGRSGAASATTCDYATTTEVCVPVFSIDL